MFPATVGKSKTRIPGVPLVSAFAAMVTKFRAQWELQGRRHRALQGRIISAHEMVSGAH